MNNQLHELLGAIGRSDDETLCISTQRPGQKGLTNIWTTIGQLPAELPQDRHVWYSLQPVKAGVTGTEHTKVKANEVSSVVALYVDLDFVNEANKDGLEPHQVAEVRDQLSEILGSEPTATVRSGGGLQPIWRLAEPVEAELGELLLASWKILVAAVVTRVAGIYTMTDEAGREIQKARVDLGVFNLDRILRAPGSVNWKSQYGTAGSPTGVTLRAGATPITEPFKKISVATEQIGTHGVPLPASKNYQRVEQAVRVGGGGTPLDDREAETWAEILEPLGWTFRGMRGQQEAWAHPDKGARDGFSALTNYEGADRDRLKVFSSNSACHPFEAEGVYSKADAFALVNRIDPTDTRAVVKALAKAGYGGDRNAWAADVAVDVDRERQREAAAVARLVMADPDATEEAKSVAQAELDGQPALFVDIGALIAGGIEKPVPSVLKRSPDAHGVRRALFYSGCVNVVYGDPEGGKTWVVLAAIAESLMAGGRAAFLDLDHNGAGALIDRLRLLGVSDDILIDQTRFLLAEPEDEEHLMDVVGALKGGLVGLEFFAQPSDNGVPTVIGIDSIGELIPMLNGDSNSADDYTQANRRVMTALARAGGTIICVDHQAKGAESRAMGAGGTIAKRRAVDGLQARVVADGTRPFAPGRGGSCLIFVGKDRHGGVRAHAGDGKEPVCGKLIMDAPCLVTGVTEWRVAMPNMLGTGSGEKGEEVDFRIRRDCLRYILDNGPVGAGPVVLAITGDDKKIRAELKHLIGLGLIKYEKVDGKGYEKYQALAAQKLPLEIQEIKDKILSWGDPEEEK